MHVQTMIDNTMRGAKNTGASVSFLSSPEDDPADALLVFVARGEKAKRAYNVVSGLYDLIMGTDNG
jgi:hypothetical protein